MKNRLNAAELEGLIGEICAPWVQELGIKVLTLDDEKIQFTMPATEKILRHKGPNGGLVSGQALMAGSDTVSFLALSYLNGRFRDCVTVDMSTNFMRPLAAGNVIYDVTVLSNGRRLATTRIDIHAEGSEKVATTSTGVFAYIED
ncbi:PaaI family thioesterase [Maritalea sp.]|uniref:PaaI family thioesterase n=1 Tax=Maritalea sp. TaxID=2003361 RepID=UPI003EF636E1